MTRKNGNIGNLTSMSKTWGICSDDVIVKNVYSDKYAKSTCDNCGAPIKFPVWIYHSTAEHPFAVGCSCAAFLLWGKRRSDRLNNYLTDKAKRKTTNRDQKKGYFYARGRYPLKSTIFWWMWIGTFGEETWKIRIAHPSMSIKYLPLIATYESEMEAVEAAEKFHSFVPAMINIQINREKCLSAKRLNITCFGKDEYQSTRQWGSR